MNTLVNLFDHQLENIGGCILSPKDLYVCKNDLLLLENSIFQNKFSRILTGDTDEKTSLDCLRIKNSKQSTREDIYSLFQSSGIEKNLEVILQEKSYKIDRCQAHVYGEGDFLSIHRDTDSCKDYVYSCVLMLSDDFSGGEFVLYNNDDKHIFKPSYGDLLVIKSDLMHEVKKITSGKRKVLVFFIKM